MVREIKYGLAEQIIEAYKLGGLIGKTTFLDDIPEPTNEDLIAMGKELVTCMDVDNHALDAEIDSIVGHLLALPKEQRQAYVDQVLLGEFQEAVSLSSGLEGAVYAHISKS